MACCECIFSDGGQASRLLQPQHFLQTVVFWWGVVLYLYLKIRVCICTCICMFNEERGLPFVSACDVWQCSCLKLPNISCLWGWWWMPRQKCICSLIFYNYLYLHQKLTAIVDCSCLKPPNISCLPWQKCICISLLFVFAIQSWLIFLTVLVGRPITFPSHVPGISWITW